MKTLTRHDLPLSVPTEVAVCRICGAPVIVEEISEITQDGRATEVGIVVDCTTHPSFSAPEYGSWAHAHWSRPYIDWMEVCAKVLAWFNANYRYTFQKVTL